MSLRYHRFDPGPCDFPAPQVPVLPPLRWAQLNLRGPVSRERAPQGTRHYARGRYALHAAYALAGVGAQGALLAPAYHCRTMLDPALRLGAEVGLYPLTPDLHADLDALKRVAAARRVRPVALLFTHYFGLPRDIAPVAEWCRAQNVVLIEDCSHALPLVAAAGCVGSVGDYAVASPYKFYPCPDGGVLWSARGAPLPPASPPSPGARRELGGWLAVARGLWQGASAVAPDASVDSSAPAGATGREWIDDSDGPSLSADYRETDEQVGSLAASRWAQRHTDLYQLVRLRRWRYAQWLAAVAGLPGCQALLPTLPDACTPYMFPLLVHEPARRFYPLKRLGMPIWRWDDMAVSDCAVSQRYRQGVFHLPCHQALGDADMAWMTAAVARVMHA